jgi:heat shock protein HslJ
MQGQRTLRHTSIALSLVAVLTLVAAACGGDDDDQPASAGTEDAGVPATADVLEATTWQLTSYADNKTGDLTAASETSVGTAKFDGTQVAGSTGCNQYSGSYTLGADGAISFGAMATTQMACNADLTAQEQGYLAGLSAARQAVIADKALQLLNEKHDTVLLFSPPSGAVLEGASWNVINYRTPTAVTSSILGADITMQFAGGNITGNSGCNDFTASYTSGSASSGDLAITDYQRGNTVCTSPPGVAEQEQAFGDALTSAVGYQIVGKRMTLLDSQGRDAVQLELAE